VVTREDTHVALIVEICNMYLNMMLINRRMKLLIIIKSNKIHKLNLLKKRKSLTTLNLVLDSEVAEAEEEAEGEDVDFKTQIVMIIKLMKIGKINQQTTIVEVKIIIMDNLNNIETEAVVTIEGEEIEEVMVEERVVNGMKIISMKTFLINEKENNRSFNLLLPIRLEASILELIQMILTKNLEKALVELKVEE